MSCSTYRLVNVSLSQLQKMAGTFEIVGIEKDDFATELTKIRSKFKQVFSYVTQIMQCCSYKIYRV